MSHYQIPDVYAARHPDVQGPLAQAVEWTDGRVAVRKMVGDTTTFLADSLEAAKAWVPVPLVEAERMPDAMLPDLWRLLRVKDVSGMSGEGYVADGVEWADGTVAYRWRTDPCTTQMADSIEDVRHIHGHNGKSQVRWVER